MGLLQPAAVEQSAAKVGVFGRQGSGKTTTSVLIAIGLSKTYHNSAPIAMLDTENGSDYVKELCDTEGVPFLVVKSRAFKDMRQALTEAEQAGCCAYVVDSYSHPWVELTDSFKAKSRRKRLEFHHMNDLKSIWRGWTDQMLNSPLHVILSGRLGYEWGEEEDRDGERKLIKLGTKMKSESEAGYEPSLLIEMESLQDDEARQKQTRRKKGSIIHHVYVLKDRWRSLNGRVFQFKDMNEYKAGGYEPVFTAFSSHWSKLAIGQATQRAVDGSRNSQELFTGPQGESAYQERQRRVQIASEEIEGVMKRIWPGQDAKSKTIKLAILDTLFGTTSWTAVLGLAPERLESAVPVLKTCLETVKDGHDALTDENSATALIDMCRERVADANVV